MRELKSGDQCTACLAGKMTTRSVYDSGGWHIRYIVCGRCGQRSQQVLPGDQVQRRSRKSVKQKTEFVKQTGSLQTGDSA